MSIFTPKVLPAHDMGAQSKDDKNHSTLFSDTLSDFSKRVHEPVKKMKAVQDALNKPSTEITQAKVTLDKCDEEIRKAVEIRKAAVLKELKELKAVVKEQPQEETAGPSLNK